MSTDRLRIALVAPSRYPLTEPFAGGLETVVATLARGLRARGHEVALFAVAGTPGADPRFAFPGVRWPAGVEVRDHTYPPGEREAETAAFAALADLLAGSGGRDPGVDVVHNHSLHPGLLEAAPRLAAPTITTLHTPPFHEMRDPLVAPGADPGLLTAVSAATARSWDVPQPVTVVPNGIDTDRFVAGPGGEDLVWSGRIGPDKAPHLAVAAARAVGRQLVLAGRVEDEGYFRREIAPYLGAGVEHVGHLGGGELARLVGRSACALVTPTWEEPFGLVAAEALACGTPVAGLPRGGLPEVLGPFAADCLDLDLPAAITRALTLPRAAVRAHAVDALSLAHSIDRYEQLYRAVIADRPRPGPAPTS